MFLRIFISRFLNNIKAATQVDYRSLFLFYCAIRGPAGVRVYERLFGEAVNAPFLLTENRVKSKIKVGAAGAASDFFGVMQNIIQKTLF